jgi:hypothetical protein
MAGRRVRQAASVAPRFYLGTHKAGWLTDPAADFPLFISHRTLARVRRLRRATCRWALDSGGFTELSTYGTWRTSPAAYVEAVARYGREIGQLDWAAQQDWMCEPQIIRGGSIDGRTVPGTGLSVTEHQRRTVANYLELRELWPQYSDAPCPIRPTVQGWSVGEYVDCMELYASAGVDLAALDVVAVGSVCRRQGTIRAGIIFRELASAGLRLHAFGIKTTGLADFGSVITSADSMAWSFDARHGGPLPGHTHKSCANCLEYAADWRRDLHDQMESAGLRAA